MISAQDIKDLVQIFKPNSDLDPFEFLSRIINLFIVLAGIIAVVFLIYSGVLYITAGGDTARAQKAQRAAVNVIIGIIIISLSYLIVAFVGRITSQILS